MHILAIDIGTSSVKAAVLKQASGQPVGPVAKAAYALLHTEPEMAAIDPEQLWQAMNSAVSQACQRQQVDGIGISSLTPCLVLLDQHDKPLLPFVTHLDRRARPTAKALDARLGTEFLRETGNRPLPGGISAIYFKHWTTQYPDQLRRVHRYLHLNSWIALKLTGQTGFDPGNADFTGLCRWEDVTWSPEWCSQLGVMPSWLPAIVPGNTAIGGLRKEWADAWALPENIPVMLGVADTSSAILAADMEPGDLLHLVGTTQVLAILTDAPQPSPQRLTRHLGVGESYLHVTHNPVGGVALDWLHQLCFADVPEAEYYSTMIERVLERQTTVTLDPVFLGGDRLEIEEKKAGFKNLSLATDRLDLLAALLQAMRTGHRAAWQALGRSHTPKRIFLSGGGAKVVRRLLPEYHQLEVIELEQASLLGVAKLFGTPSVHTLSVPG
ncbi:MAG: FGGY-family carbohydrate kinase [Gemmatales bacterium]